MTPPRAEGIRQNAETPEAPPAASFCILKTRAEFLQAASARRQGTTSFLLQGRDRQDGTLRIQVGFTASKKIGNAVTRNRAKRRLRAAARAVLPGLARPGWDYVLVARPQATVARPWADLVRDVASALRAVHDAPAKGHPR